MKFHATVVFEFSAHDVGEAGGRLVHAAEHRLETRSLELAHAGGDTGDAAVGVTRLDARRPQSLRLAFSSGGTRAEERGAWTSERSA
jgi:hypothetical protein